MRESERLDSSTEAEHSVRVTSRAGAALAIGLAAAAVAMGALLIEPAPAIPQLAASNWAPTPEPPQLQEPAAANDGLPPVLVRNPFDQSEVFEFPAGTSKTAARDAVAEMLLQRARERQH